MQEPPQPRRAPAPEPRAVVPGRPAQASPHTRVGACAAGRPASVTSFAFRSPMAEFAGSALFRLLQRVVELFRELDHLIEERRMLEQLSEDLPELRVVQALN